MVFQARSAILFLGFPVEKLFLAIIALKMAQNMGRNKATSVAYAGSDHRHLRSR